MNKIIEADISRERYEGAAIKCFYCGKYSEIIENPFKCIYCNKTFKLVLLIED